jgi:hypothetical protein
MADGQPKTQQPIFDCDLGSIIENVSHREEAGVDVEGDSDGDACSSLVLSESAVLAHNELMQSRESRATDNISLTSSDVPEVGSTSDDFSAGSEADSVTDSDGTALSSNSDAEFELRSPAGPHGPGEVACRPCCFFARGICRREDTCSYCHEHPYVPRPIRRFGKRNLNRSSDEVVPDISA